MSTSRRLLSRIGLAALALLVVVEIFIPLHAHFSIADFFSFHALFGFGSCVLMVIGAKGLSFILKRKEDYYDDS
ncbi:MAG: hypothetical protein ACYYK0_05530 [Candidatus Eutrophobiaceae bacterium]